MIANLEIPHSLIDTPNGVSYNDSGKIRNQIRKPSNKQD